MWRNVEVRDFVLWLRDHNAQLPAAQRVEFRGLDIYSLGSSIAAVLAYLDRTIRKPPKKLADATAV